MKTDIKITLVGSTYKLSLLFVLFYLILLTSLLSLGFWQLGRADEKRVFLALQKESENKPATQLALLDLSSKNIRHRKIEVSGRYDTQHQYLIDNQIVNGQAGYFVMTPLKIEGMDKAVLVNRGWVVLNKDRRILPDITFSATDLRRDSVGSDRFELFEQSEFSNFSEPTLPRIKSVAAFSTTKIILHGRINHFPSVGMQLAGAEIPTEGWPSVVQVVDSHVLAKKLGYSLLPFQIELEADMNNGYQREWKKRAVMSPEKHIGYSIQWFGLALALTVLFIKISKEQ